MKKLICYILTLSLLLSVLPLTLMSCGKKEIILTNENFDEYFMINVYSDNYSKGKDTWGFSIASCTLTVEIIPLIDLKATNVVLIFQVNPSSWEATDFYKEDSICLMKITLPSDGELKKVVQCSYSSIWGLYPNTPSCWVMEVSGTIIV